MGQIPGTGTRMCHTWAQWAIGARPSATPRASQQNTPWLRAELSGRPLLHPQVDPSGFGPGAITEAGNGNDRCVDLGAGFKIPQDRRLACGSTAPPTSRRKGHMAMADRSEQ